VDLGIVAKLSDGVGNFGLVTNFPLILKLIEPVPLIFFTKAESD
jgi:hypothetical protein